MFKKSIIMMLLSTLLLSLFPFASQAAEETKKVTIKIDGLELAFTDAHPFIESGRTMIPYNAVASALKLAVSWDGTTRSVTASDKDTMIKMQIGSKTAYVNGQAKTLDVPPAIYNSRTFVPLSFLSTSAGFDVKWDQATYTVFIASPAKQMAVTAFYALGGTTASGKRYSSWTNLFGKTYPETSKGNTDIVSHLALGWYSLDSQGNVLTQHVDGWQRPDGWEDVLKQSDTYKLNTEMVIFMKDDKGDISSLLENKSAMETAVANIVNEARMYKGVNLDFENLGWEGSPERAAFEKQAFTSFVQLLDKKLEEVNLSLSLTLHPLNSAFKGYDYKTLGSLADQIIVMAYNYNKSGTLSNEEPKSLVEEAIKLAVAEVPADKLLLGISTPNETAETVLTKVGIAKKYDLKGIALWYLGPISDDMWLALRQTILPRN